MNRNPYAPPESTVDEESVVSQRASDPVRGSWLAALLIILFIANVAMTFFYFLVAIGKISLPRSGAWAPTLLALVAANVIFLVAMWNWRRWGYFGLIGTTTLLFSTHIAQGQTIGDATTGVLGLVLLIVVASFKLKHFK